MPKIKPAKKVKSIRKSYAKITKYDSNITKLTHMCFIA